MDQMAVHPILDRSMTFSGQCCICARMNCLDYCLEKRWEVIQSFVRNETQMTV